MFKRLLLVLFLTMAFSSCTMRTNTISSTIFDTGIRAVNIGNYQLTEWGTKPADYEEYLGTYILSCRYVFRHDGTVKYRRVYLDHGVQTIEEDEGTYYSRTLGPNATIQVSLSYRSATLTWEPNPREPDGSLVFRLWEERIMPLPKANDSRPEECISKLYFMFYSENISPHPL